uniref:Methyltransferase domain-containing protein n=1 Tax=Anopheles atroparvus TaxID=41427 RepID=A0AAG5DS82_ANOAO
MELYLTYHRIIGITSSETGVPEFHRLDVPLESYIILTLYRYLNIHPSNVGVHFVRCKAASNVLSVILPSSGFGMLKFFDQNIDEKPPTAIHDPALFCQLPSISSRNAGLIVSGLCGVCRRITQEHVSHNESSVGLLGFKGNTLVAPADASLWTKFCELDMVRCVGQILQCATGRDMVNHIMLPDEIGQLESHLQQPLKSHNIYKLINLVNNVRISSDGEHRQLTDTKQRFDFHANHKFAEGYEKTLADIMLFICLELVERRLGHDLLRQKLPHVSGWFGRVNLDDEGRLYRVCNEILPASEDSALANKLSIVTDVQVRIPQEFSLYKSDTKKLNLKGDQILTTNQAEVEEILRKVETIRTDIGSRVNDWDTNVFEWESIPLEARPEGGKLPAARVLRKRHQIESLVNEVVQLASDGDTIVDFCSGTGHLGIILAHLLPRCSIYLLENKEESQQRAMERVARLGLRNVTFFQCNLDYFTARFDIGVSLHACGVATDIVLEKCFAQKAHFVSCPCCYGKLYNIAHVAYPRSRLFQDSGLLLKEYFCIAHCADQTHDLTSDRTNVAKAQQGFHCMDVIDTDRALRAEELGYRVDRKRLKDESCTPKNRLLIGSFNR